MYLVHPFIAFSSFLGLPLGAGKDTLIITPLMDFVRQKRASKGGSRVLFVYSMNQEFQI